MRSQRFRLTVAVVFCLLVSVLVVTGQSPGVATRRVEADPAAVWVVNQSVADFLNASTVDFNTPAGRAAVASNLSALQSASGGQISPQPSISGQVLVLVQTDGSNTSVVLNGRGLTCAPACDNVSSATPNASDHFVVYSIIGSGSRNLGDAFVVTAFQASVSLDSPTLHIVGQAHDVALSADKLTLLQNAPDCTPSSNASDATHTVLYARYLDINGTPLVGYHPTFNSSNPSSVALALSAATTVVHSGPDASADTIACGGSSVGSSTISTTSAPNEIQGLAGGTVTRTISIAIGPPPLIPGTISTFAGGGHADEGLPASAAVVCCPHALGFDGGGNLFVSDDGTCRLRRVSGGVINTIAGAYQTTNLPINNFCQYGGDGGSALDAGIEPGGVAVSGSNVYVADTRHCRIRLVSGGTITTVAGTSSCGYNGDGPATSSSLSYPVGLAVSGGDLYIADAGNCRVRKLSGGTLSTVAGTGTCGYNGEGAATSKSLSSPADVAFDASGNLYIADQDNCRVRMVSSAVISTVAGNGTCGYTGEGAATGVALNQPGSVALDGSGNVYIAAEGDCRVREVSAGAITTIAGTGSCGSSDDDGAATSAALGLRAYRFYINDYVQGPSQVRVLGTDVYVADASGCRVRKISGGVISRALGYAGHCWFAGGDGGPATSAGFLQPSGVAVDSSDAVYVSDSSACVIRKISGGIINTIAGNETCGFGGDNGPATAASLNRPGYMALDAADHLYIADGSNCRIREVNGGVITTVAGSGTCGYNGDGISALSAQLNHPSGVAIDKTGAIYIADTSNCRVRKVVAGNISTVAGNGTCAYNVDGIAATSSQLRYPANVAVDASGNVYISDSGNCRVRAVRGPVITTLAGNGAGAPNYCSYSGDGVAATSASLDYPDGLAVDPAGNVYIVDDFACTLRQVSEGTIRTIAGQYQGSPGNALCPGSYGDGGPATSADINRPFSVALDGTGRMYISEQLTRVIRRVTAPDSEGDGVPDHVDNCAFFANPSQANNDAASNWPWIKDGAGVDGAAVGGDACDPDNDNDHCSNSKELGADPLTGGDRDPLNPWDFFDVPTPVLTAANGTGMRSGAITIGDVIGVLFYIGTTAANPTQTNANLAIYGSDWNANGMPDGKEYDRSASTDQSKPWRSGAPNGVVSIGDAIVMLSQLGANCT